MPGRFFRRLVRCAAPDPQCCGFQSPRCRGASSDQLAATPEPNPQVEVSIPSMPGRFFRRDGDSGTCTIIPSCFNPLDAGALLQTLKGMTKRGPRGCVSIPSMPGALLQTDREDVVAVAKQYVSIPSMPGRFFRRPASQPVVWKRDRNRFSPTATFPDARPPKGCPPVSRKALQQKILRKAPDRSCGRSRKTLPGSNLLQFPLFCQEVLR